MDLLSGIYEFCDNGIMPIYKLNIMEYKNNTEKQAVEGYLRYIDIVRELHPDIAEKEARQIAGQMIFSIQVFQLRVALSKINLLGDY